MCSEVISELSSETLSASLEDYLEAIYHIAAAKRVARAKDIVKRLNVGSSSVTGALHALADRELINYVPYDVITLTSNGERVAREIVRKHEVLRDFFVKVLGVEAKDAETGACKMEHAVPRVILERFIEFVEFVEVCPRGGPEWIEIFKHHCRNRTTLGNCEECVEACVEEIRRRTPPRKKGADASIVLHALVAGQKGKIVELAESMSVDDQLADIGATVGAVVEVERIAPDTCTMDIKVKGYHLSLTPAEAEGIRVEVL
jgi:DtxR family Mn-dependent transcriptional regulator